MKLSALLPLVRGGLYLRAEAVSCLGVTLINQFYPDIKTVPLTYFDLTVVELGVDTESDLIIKVKEMRGP